MAPALEAQTAKSATPSAPWKSYCQPVANFCFKYPPGWQMLGEVFEGNGAVVAPPQKQEQQLWDSVTVARVIPPPQDKDDAMTAAEAITQAESGVRANGQNFQTLERRQRMVDGNPAEIVKLRYTENSTGRDWIEELVFIEGPSSEVYSLALKSSPSGLTAIEPQFSRIVDSWRLNAEDQDAKPSAPADQTNSNPKSPASPKF
jgi:hypothetical protein